MRIDDILIEYDELFEKRAPDTPKSDDGEGLDVVKRKENQKDFKDRTDKDIDNDGDTDESDEYLHKRRKAIAKNVIAKEKKSKK